MHFVLDAGVLLVVNNYRKNNLDSSLKNIK